MKEKETRLIEVDHARIRREAMIQTALGQPDFAQKEFEKYRKTQEHYLRKETMTTAWAKVAWLAEGRMSAMGRTLDKLQQRIGRQRKANREQHRALSSTREELKQKDEVLLNILKQAESHRSYNLDMSKSEDPWIRQIYDLSHSALYPESEGQSGPE